MRRFSLLLVLMSFSVTVTFSAEEERPETWISQIHRAIFDGQADAAEELLTKHPELIQAQEQLMIPSRSDGYTPLHTASARGNLPIARWLLAHGADINAPALGKTKDGRKFGFGHTPLEAAVESDQLESVKFLIQAKARVNGASEVHLAVLNDNGAMAKYLLEHGGEGDLFSAAALGELEELKKMLESHPDLELRAEHGYTPLHMAAVCGQMETAKLLLASKAKIDAESQPAYADRGDTPLIVAIRHGHSDLARYFIQAGADVNLNGGDSAVSVAVEHDDLLTLQALLKRQAKIEQRDLDGRTPLLAAVSNKKGEMATALLENGADPNAKEEASRLPNGTDPSRRTSLDVAVQAHSKAFCELLLHYGGKLNRESNENLKEVLKQKDTEPPLLRN